MKKYQVFLLIAVMFITVFSFYPVLKADFIDLDDMIFVEGNWKINSLSLENIKALLFESHFSLYHPIVNISFAIENYFFGIDPYFYHADNLILHLLNILLVFWAFYLITKKKFFISLIVAFIFACHPMHVESVAWISSRKDTLYTFFFFLSIISYLESQGKTKKIGLYILSIIFFIFSCLSKSMAVTLPAVLILIDWFQGNKFNKERLLKYIPFFIITVIFSIITYQGYYDPEAKFKHSAYMFFVNFISAHFNILFYMVKFFFPVKLSIIYPPFFSENTFPPDFILRSPALIYALFFLISASLKYTKKIFFGFALFIILISPVINVFPIGIAPVADRYTYVPFIGFAYILGTFIIFLYNKIKIKYLKNIYICILSALFLIMSIQCNAQARVWHNTKTLFDNQIKNYPGQIAQAYTVIGNYYGDINMPEEQEKNLLEAFRIDHNNPITIFSLAGLKKSQKKYDEALSLYSRILPIDPNVNMSYINMGQIYYEIGDKEKAVEFIEKAVEHDYHSTYVHSFYSAGNFYYNMGEKDKAAEYFIEAKKYFPKSSATYINLANIYLEKKDLKSALEVYLEAIVNTNADPGIVFNMALIYFDIGYYDSAEKLFLNILEREPGHGKAYDYLGSIYAIKGENKKALHNFTMAVLIDNEQGDAYFHRAVLHYEMQKYDLAKDDILRAEKKGFEVPESFKESLNKELKDNRIN